METSIKTNQSGTFVRNAKTISRAEVNFWSSLEFNRYGIISMLVIVIGCVGGIAAAFGAGADTLKIAMIAFPSVIALALILAVSPMKAIVYAGSIAILLDILVLIF
ncbi:MAG: hypothetical protein K0S33_3814 [Bacteroidetes bacterium]|jgi:hypothetical protein|nr:hypothetical protein [Bacteroidota bacterium]